MVIWVNKLDREHADFFAVVEQARTRMNMHAVVLQLPIGREASFRGVVDLLTGRAYISQNGKTIESDPPPDMEDDIALYRDRLCEAVAETDDGLIDKYLEGEPLSDQELHNGLRQAVQSGTLVPVLCGSALLNIGINPLLDFLAEYLPMPQESRQPHTADGATLNGTTAAVSCSKP